VYLPDHVPGDPAILLLLPNTIPTMIKIQNTATIASTTTILVTVLFDHLADLFSCPLAPLTYRRCDIDPISISTGLAATVGRGKM
jgi:hypothetical protein